MTKILFDTSHNERMDIHGQYSNIRLLIQENGFKTEKYEEFPITANAIKEYEVIVFGGVDGSKFFAHELRELIDYASEGGSILICSHSGGDSGMGTNTNEILKDSGIYIERNQVQDYYNCWSGIPSHIEISRFASRPVHPVVSDLRKICYISGCELMVDQPGIGLAFAEGGADPPNACLVAISKFRSGRIGVIGSHRMFSNSKAGIGLYDNSYLFTRMIRWLSRMDDETVVAPVKIPKKMSRTVYYKPPKISRPSKEAVRQLGVINSSENDDEQLVRPSRIAQIQGGRLEEVESTIYRNYPSYQPSEEFKPTQREMIEPFQSTMEFEHTPERISETLNKLINEMERIGVTLNSMNEDLHYIRSTLTKLMENKGNKI